MVFQAIKIEYVKLIIKHMQHTAGLVAVTWHDTLKMQKEDTYDLYAHHTVQTPEGIEALFNHVTVSRILNSILCGSLIVSVLRILKFS